MLTYLKNILVLIRIQHYIKNLFIFLPLFFALKIMDVGLLFHAFCAFVGFSLTVSSIYILNDYHDIEEDRAHPRKKYRPLASKSIPTSHAIIIMLILFVSGLALMASISFKAAGILLLYVVMNVLYSFFFKHVSIIDVVIIAVGFVLRLFCGSAVTDIPLSMWIVLMTFLLSVFLALAKRRDDVLIFLETGNKMRKVVDGYNLKFLDTAMSIMASVVIVAYTIYTASPDVIAKAQSEHLYLTVLFVIIGIMRYLQITFVLKGECSPTKILWNDRFIQLILIGWIGTFALILYF